MFDHNRSAVKARLVLTLLGLFVYGSVPAAEPGYGLLPGDILIISVWKEEDLSREVMVEPDGKISFPLAGEISVRGRSTEEVRVELVQRLKKFIPEPEVSVALKQILGNTIYVIGKVNRPGAFVMTGDVDVMQALSLAGGTNAFAALNDIKVLRRSNGNLSVILFKYGEVEDGKNLDQNIVLRSGDTVVVP